MVLGLAVQTQTSLIDREVGEAEMQRIYIVSATAAFAVVSEMERWNASNYGSHGFGCKGRFQCLL